MLFVQLLLQGPTCDRFNAAALALVESQREVTQVLLISTWIQAKEGILTDATGRRFTVSESIALFDRQFGVTLAELKGMGKQVYVWEPLPGAKQDVPKAMAMSELDARTLDLDFTRTEYMQRNDFFFSALNKQRGSIAGYLR